MSIHGKAEARENGKQKPERLFHGELFEIPEHAESERNATGGWTIETSRVIGTIN
jgi:hypothetical protein